MRTVEALILAARFIISGTLLISAVTHFLAPLAFLESVYSYQIVGGSAGWLIALALPAIALSVSLGLLDNQLARHALKAAILLFAAFLSAQLVVLYRGLVDRLRLLWALRPDRRYCISFIYRRIVFTVSNDNQN